jgi:hypothetical protein
LGGGDAADAMLLEQARDLGFREFGGAGGRGSQLE